MKTKDLTTSEAGKLGGDKTNNIYGKAHYSNAGKKSWEARKAKYGPDFMKGLRNMGKKKVLDKQPLV